MSIDSVPNDSIRFLDQVDFYFDLVPNFIHHLCMGLAAELTNIYLVVRMRRFFYQISHGVVLTFMDSIHR